MIMLTQECPTAETLRKYLDGRSAEDDATRLEGHLDDCPSCAARISDMESDAGSLIGCLRLAHESPVADAQTEVPPRWAAKIAEEGPESLGRRAEAAKAGPRRTVQAPQLKDYEIRGVLGRGGMSVVFAARHRYLDREVAIKILHPLAGGPGARRRFDAEMRTIASLEHPAIVKALDAGVVDGSPYLVMERVDGLDLARLARHLGVVSLRQVVAIGARASEGLLAAHQQGVTHRDVKPSNLAMDRSGRLRILDFGLARRDIAAQDVTLHTTVGQLIGTLDYMAPELVAGEQATKVSDLYSLAATLFALWTGQPPHGRSKNTPLLPYLKRVAAERAPRAASLRPDTPDWLDQLLADCLALAPGDRPTCLALFRERLLAHSDDPTLTAAEAELAAAVQEALQSEPAPAHEDIENALDQAAPSLLQTEDWKRDLHEPTPKQAKPGASRLSALVVAAVVLAVLGPLAALGVVFSLQTPQGTLIVESETDHVRLELLDEGNQVTQLQLATGEQETVLRAGKYRVRIPEGSDQVQVAPSQFTLRRGKEIVAKVTLKSPEMDGSPHIPLRRMSEGPLGIRRRQNHMLEGPPAAIAGEAVAPIPDEPVYQGRPYKDWSTLAKFERDRAARAQALVAVATLFDSLPVHTRARTAAEFAAEEARSASPAWIDLVGRRNTLFRDLEAQVVIKAGEALQALASTKPGTVNQAIHDQALASANARRQTVGLLLLASAGDAAAARPDAFSDCLERAEQLRQTGAKDLHDLATVVLARCLADKSQAADLLASAEWSSDAFNPRKAALRATRIRRLPVPRNMQLNWFGKWLATWPVSDESPPWFAPENPLGDPAASATKPGSFPDAPPEEASIALRPLVEWLAQDDDGTWMKDHEAELAQIFAGAPVTDALASELSTLIRKRQVSWRLQETLIRLDGNLDRLATGGVLHTNTPLLSFASAVRSRVVGTEWSSSAETFAEATQALVRECRQHRRVLKTIRAGVAPDQEGLTAFAAYQVLHACGDPLTPIEGMRQWLKAKPTPKRIAATRDILPQSEQDAAYAKLPITTELLYWARTQRGRELGPQLRKALETWVDQELAQPVPDSARRQTFESYGRKRELVPLRVALEMLLEDPTNPNRVPLAKKIREIRRSVNAGQGELARALNGLGER